MPKIPSAQQMGLGNVPIQTGRGGASPTPFQRLNTNTDMFGGADARNAGAVSRGLADLSNQLEDMAIRQEAQRFEEDKTAATQAVLAANDSFRKDMLENFYKLEGSQLFTEGNTTDTLYKHAQHLALKYRKTGAIRLQKGRQRDMYDNMWSVQADKELGSVSNHIAKQYNVHRGEVSKNYVAAMDNRMVELYTSVEQDWRQYENAHHYIGNQLFEARHEAGVPKDMVEGKLTEYSDYIDQAAVSGWYKEQPDHISAAVELFTGDISEPKIKAIWGDLEPEERVSLRKRLMDETNAVIKIKNDRVDAAEKAAKAKVDQDIADFWSTHEKNKRIEIYAKNLNNPLMPREVRNAMKEDIYGGPVSTDNEQGLLELEEAIRNGDIRSYGDAEAFRYGVIKPGRSETMRTRIYPLIDSMMDREFRDAMKVGLSNLGIAEVAAETDPVLKARAARFQSEFLLWKHSEGSKKGGNPFDAADRIAKRMKDEFKTDPNTMTMLKAMKKKYDDALNSGDTQTAAERMEQITKMLNLLGLNLEDIK